MCGIYGLVHLKDGPGPMDDVLARMGNVIRHRGPNDFGHYSGKGIGLGMRRLSIIDLEGGHQPIANEDKTIWVVCNGEIYNFKELRLELQARGHFFRCESDTEILVHLYEELGLDFLKRLRGMFAIALWDAQRSRLVLARDRLGKKPLYTYRDSHRMWFASEIKSLLEVRQIPRTLDHGALEEYLALGYVPAPKTLFKGIAKLSPGHCMVIENGDVRDLEYWDVPVGPIENRSEDDWVEQVRDKLVEAVRIRMVSDVPLGAFLSGGIDSSSIVAVMARLTQQPVKTYSIGFEGNDLFYNELPHARVVAKAFSTDHHEIIVRPEIAHLFPKLIWHLDEPIADSAFVTTYLVAKLAAESVTVIMSGVGGDELFGGYRRYLGNNLGVYYRHLPAIARKKWLPALIASLPKDRHSAFKNYFRYAEAFVKSFELDPASRYVSYVTLFSPELQQSLLKNQPERQTVHGSFGTTAMTKYFATRRDMTILSQLMFADLKTSFPDDLLALTDKMTMAVSLECRAPFVDHELVELAAKMPDSLKVRGFTMKYLLKKVVAPWLPREILHRKKRGFGAPVGSWMRNQLKSLVESLLSEDQINKRGLFNWTVIREIVAKHNAQQGDYSDQLLALISLELWCRIYLDGTNYNDLTEMMRRVSTSSENSLRLSSATLPA
jgi:asparagine synthase (glutamine-hydrolysing)